jgi:hypothetical protein
LGCQFLPQPVKAAADAGVEPARADLENETADEVRIDGARGAHLAPGCLADPRDEPVEVLL